MITAQQIEAARRDYVAAMGTPAESQKRDVLAQIVALAKQERR